MEEIPVMVAKIHSHRQVGSPAHAHPHQHGAAVRRRALAVFSDINGKQASNYRLNITMKPPATHQLHIGCDQVHGACGGCSAGPIFSPRIEALSNSLQGLCFSIRDGRTRTPRKHIANRFRRNSTGILTISIPSTPKPECAIGEDEDMPAGKVPENSPRLPPPTGEWNIDLHAPFLVRSPSNAPAGSAVQASTGTKTSCKRR